MSDEPLIAVFVDFENLALGVRDMKAGKFQIQLVLKRLLEKGRIVFKRAYCDWRNYDDAVREFHGQGIELIDIPQSKMSGKNSADIRMVVDAMDLCYSKQHIDTFALLSGDSDFSPLVSKLKENHRRVIGCGVKSSTSDLLIANCDEFMYYDDLVRTAKKTPKAAKKEKTEGDKTEEDKRQEAFERVLEVVHSVEQVREAPIAVVAFAKPRIHAANRLFEHRAPQRIVILLEEIQDKGLLELDYDDSRGNYKVRRRRG
jgi:uncharacterized protein (TIGR00288 family)